MDIFGIDILWIIAILIPIIIFIIMALLYTIVPANVADVVVKRGKRTVFSSDPKHATDGKAAYFKIPSWVPYAGMEVHRMPLSMIEIPIPDFLAFDKDRARFLCDIVAFGVIKDPVTSAIRFPKTMDELGKQLSKVVRATTRDSTTKKQIRDIINDREGILDTIREPLTDALANWGIELRDIELVEFKDPTEKEYGEEAPPHVIKDISSIIEVQINSEARQKNAEQKKMARIKEAAAEESAKIREWERDEKIGIREKQKDQEVYKEAKIAKEQELEVEKVQKVKTQEIEKERAVVQASQEKEVETINKEQKQLIGEGDRLMKEEQAKGEAAYIREQGYADADAKEKLQNALNKFKDPAIRALVAEKLVEMEKETRIATAEALKAADLRIFSGGQGAQKGFDLGQLLESASATSTPAGAGLMNRLSRPNDLGFRELGAILGVFDEYQKLNDEQKEQFKDEIIKEDKEPVKKTRVKKPKKKLEDLP